MFEEFLAIYKIVVPALVYIACIIHVVFAKNLGERIHTSIVLIGYFALVYFINDLLLATIFLAGWLIINNIHLLISRATAILLLAILVFVGVYSPGFIIIGYLLYIIILWGFLTSALRKLTGAGNETSISKLPPLGGLR